MEYSYDIKSNIIAWYSFKKSDRILEISADDNLKDFFQNIANDYTTIKIKKDNVFVNIKEEKITSKYDYIILIGSFEYSPLFMKNNNPYTELLKYLKQFLNPKGKIIFSINNRFGIKYFAGAKSKHYNNIFGSITNDININNSNLLSKKEIIDIIANAGFKNYKFYYPVPDYRLTSAIFTDDFIPESSTSKLMYQLYYNEESIILYNEIQAIKQICDSNLFDKMCNSYLVEISKETIDNDIRFISYNNLRKDEYNLMIKIDKSKAYKYSTCQESQKHLDDMKLNIEKLTDLGFNILEKVENDIIISEFIKNDELDKIIVSLIKYNKTEEAIIKIKNWFDYISSKLGNIDINDVKENNIYNYFNIEVSDDMLNKMNFTKYGFIDLSFENVFLIDNDYVFYDQEWFFPNIPLEFIIYRAINNLYCYNETHINNFLKFDDMLKRFEIYEFKDSFNKLEKEIQNYIMDKSKVNNYVKKIPPIYNIEHILKRANDAEIVEELNRKLKEEKEELIEKNKKIEEENKKLSDNYNSLVQSRSYRTIQKIKKILYRGK
ncbi:MAG: hypothetical protein IKF52_03190 [Clostridia bacterium]|nr:hypothetical protein [Clostridia bacterium]